MTDKRPTTPQQAGVPRRFSVGVLMVMVTMYAVLFALLATVDVPPLLFIAVALFFTAVGVAQTLLYGGRNPRKASVAAGAWSFGVVFPIAAIVMCCLHPPRFSTVPEWIFSLIVLVTGEAYIVGVGSLLGYLVGVLVSGVFLFIGREP